MGFEDVNSKTQPKGCFYDDGIVAFYYNSAESSTQCSVDGSSQKCHCVVDEDKEEEETEEGKEEFKIIEEGVCGKSVSKETCQNEASKDGVTFEDVNSKTQPKGCFYDDGIVAFYYNSAESSTQCSVDGSSQKCYCVVDEDKEEEETEEGKEEFKIIEEGVCGKSVSKETC